MRHWMRGAALGWGSILGIFGNGFIVTEARAVAAAPASASARLSDAIQRAIRADGSFFTAEEQAIISRKCGYAPGQWDGFQVSITDGAFHCSNGKVADDLEMRWLLQTAQPRIGVRVNEAMASAEVREAIAAVAQEATDRALRQVGESLLKRR